VDMCSTQLSDEIFKAASGETNHAKLARKSKGGRVPVCCVPKTKLDALYLQLK